MKRLLAILVLCGGFTLSIGAQAQETSFPTPQSGGGSIVTQQEVDLVRGFFSALNEATQAENDSVTITDIVKDVVKAVSAPDSGVAQSDNVDEARDNDNDDDDDDDDKGKGEKKKKNKGQSKKAEKAKGRGNGLPPGLQKHLAKTGQLPPGLQRKLEAAGSLPPGLQASALPTELEAHLPQLPEGQQRVVIDDDMVIIEQATGIILDAIPDIIPPDLVPILKQLPDLIPQQ